MSHSKPEIHTDLVSHQLKEVRKPHCNSEPSLVRKPTNSSGLDYLIPFLSKAVQLANKGIPAAIIFNPLPNGDLEIKLQYKGHKTGVKK